MNVLIISSITDAAVEKISAVDSRRLNVIDARGWFDGEIRDTWPDATVSRYLGNSPRTPAKNRFERDQALSNADIILGGFPYPMDIRARAPRLRWFHQTPAGASNLMRGDLWGSDVMVTTSRGYGNIRPIAEYVLAGFAHFARAFHRAYRDQRRHRFDHHTYQPVVLEGKTVSIVGAGGIGQEIARVCAGIGMRIVGTRRSSSPAKKLPQFFSRLESPDHLDELLSESDFVAICCQWTPETDKLFNRKVFAAMKPGSILVNVARGEIIDEPSLVDALQTGTLRGVVLDVYDGEFDHEPDRRLWDDERVLITPHISSFAEKSQHRGVDLFCENLGAFIEGRTLKNVVDWERGY
jgi:phosphoglycerate dehydrogenase-like enzyme